MILVLTIFFFFFIFPSFRYLVYACHSVIVVQEVASGKQRHLLGHTDVVTGLAWPDSQAMLASSQALAIKLWSVSQAACLATM